MNTPSAPTRQALVAGLLIAMAGAILFAGKAIVAKLMYRYQIDALTLMTLRMLMAVPMFIGIAIWQGRKLPSLSWRDRLRIVFLGLIGYYLSSLLDFMGLQYITAGLERLIMFLTPSFVLLLTVVVYGRRTRLYDWVALAVSYSGTVLVLIYDLETSGSQVWLGSAFVLMSAIAYAIYLLLSGELVGRVGALRLSSYAMCVSTVACVVHFLVQYTPAQLVQPAAVYQLSVVNAVFCTVLPVVMTMVAVQRIGAAATSQAGLIGPVSTLFMGAILLDEPVTLVQLAGTALVLCGIYMVTQKKT